MQPSGTGGGAGPGDMGDGPLSASSPQDDSSPSRLSRSDSPTGQSALSSSRNAGGSPHSPGHSGMSHSCNSSPPAQRTSELAGGSSDVSYSGGLSPRISQSSAGASGTSSVQSRPSLGGSGVCGGISGSFPFAGSRNARVTSGSSYSYSAAADMTLKRASGPTPSCSSLPGVGGTTRAGTSSCGVDGPASALPMNTTSHQASAHFWHQLTLSSSPGARAAHSCDVIGRKLFVFGGWNGKNALNDLFILDVKRGEWTQVKPNLNAPDQRNNHTTAVVDNKLFVHGGHDGGQWLGDLHVLDTTPAHLGKPQELSWQKLQVSGLAPSVRACHTLSRVNQKLYMFGGYDGAKCFHEIDVLDLETMSWIQPKVTGNKPLARNAHSMTVVDTKMYLFGGHSGNKHLTDLHLFDTTTLMWSQPIIAGSPPPGLRGHTATLIGTRIFLFGGYDGKGRSNELHVLDTEGRAWVSCPEGENTPSGRQRHTASLIGSRQLYVFGGFDGYRWLNDLHVLDIGRLEEDALSDSAVRNLISNLRKLINNPEFSDITLVVEDRVIYAHKNILAASCEYFQNMFTGSMKESSQTQIIIHGWSYEAFMNMIEFLYTGRISESCPTVLCEILGLADHYTLLGLKNYCDNILQHCIDVNTVCTLLKHADSYQAPELKKQCLQFIFSHADQVMSTEAFDELQSIPSLIMEIAKISLAKNRKLESSSSTATISSAGENPSLTSSLPSMFRGPGGGMPRS